MELSSNIYNPQIDIMTMTVNKIEIINIAI